MWKPALAEIEEALVPAFIIEEIDAQTFAVFVPSVPTPLAGTVYILSRDRVAATKMASHFMHVENPVSTVSDLRIVI